jgi:anti-sigma factor RsiW
MSCAPEQVTAYVDEELEPPARAETEAHLAECATCREQVQAERALRAQLRTLPIPAARPGLDDEVRMRLQRTMPRPRPMRVLLPLAAALVALFIWARSAAPFVGWELARDHAHCFGMKRLPAEVWNGDPLRVASWFEAKGTQLPYVPGAAGGLELVGGRYCPLLDGTKMAHLYYVNDERRLSVFVLPHDVRFKGSYTAVTKGSSVRMMRVGASTIGIVSERRDDVDAFERALSTSMALGRADTSPAARLVAREY